MNVPTIYTVSEWYTGSFSRQVPKSMFLDILPSSEGGIVIRSATRCGIVVDPAYDTEVDFQVFYRFVCDVCGEIFL